MTTRRDEAADAETRKLQEKADRDRDRRRTDTTGGQRPDPREETDPPQPFSGSDH